MIEHPVVVIRLVVVVRLPRVVMVTVSVGQITMVVFMVMTDGSTMGARIVIAMGIR